MTESSFKQSKEMVFAWCKSGDHDKCRKQYGGDRIICVCDCDSVIHGVNYTPINKAMTENELDTSLASINAIMFGEGDDKKPVESENRAIKSTSPVWGDQVKEGNKIGNATASGYNYSSAATTTDSKYSYYYAEALDAANIQELEERRGNPKLGTYDYSGFESWI